MVGKRPTHVEKKTGQIERQLSISQKPPRFPPYFPRWTAYRKLDKPTDTRPITLCHLLKRLFSLTPRKLALRQRSLLILLCRLLENRTFPPTKLLSRLACRFHE